MIGLYFGHWPDQNYVAYYCMATPLLSWPKIQHFSFLQKKWKLNSGAENSFVWSSSVTAFVVLHSLPFFVTRQAKFSALSLLVPPLNPFPSHEHPSLFQILNRKAAAKKKKWKPESRSARIDLSWEHKRRMRCSLKFFSKISQSSPFFYYCHSAAKRSCRAHRPPSTSF